MKKAVMLAVSLLSLGLVSCMVVVDDDDCHHDRTTDRDTITIIYSSSVTGM
jgi:hypothetical protein